MDFQKNRNSRKKLGAKEKQIFDLNLLDKKIYAFGIGALVFWSALIGFAFYQINKPKISTSYYHANIQFRAGNEDSYDDIFLQSLTHIVDMYYDHPTWVWTLECQGLLIDMAYERYPTIFQKLQTMNQRGQMELIAPQYSHGLAVAYNFKDFAESIEYNKYLMEDVYNFTVSNVIVLQEGQWLPAFPLLKSLGFDTMIVSRDQLSYQNYYPKSPLLTYEYAGIDAFVIPAIWLPCYEGDVLHHQLALSDSERMNTGGEGAVEGDFEFNYNPEKQEQILKRHLELERINNIFMNMSDWVKYCVEKGKTEPMTKFMPESHWTPNRHQSVSRWMAWGSGESDDGIVHSRNYYTRNYIQATEIMNDVAYNQGKINQIEYIHLSNLTDEALKHLWLAQVTDTSGVNPNELEFQYCINNTAIAQNYCNEVRTYLKNKIVEWHSGIQINSLERKVITNSSLMASFSNNGVSSELSLENTFGFQLSVDLSSNQADYNVSFGNYSLNCFLNETAHTFAFSKASFTFQSRRDQFITNNQPEVLPFNNSAACNGERTEQHMIFTDNWEHVVYSPSLAENYTQSLTRSDYRNSIMEDDDYYKVPLPISNGLLYNPQSGYAIITNNTVRHISVRWEDTYVDFYENDLQYNSNYEFIVFRGTLENALLLANLINPYPFLEA